MGWMKRITECYWMGHQIKTEMIWLFPIPTQSQSHNTIQQPNQTNQIQIIFRIWFSVDGWRTWLDVTDWIDWRWRDCLCHVSLAVYLVSCAWLGGVLESAVVLLGGTIFYSVVLIVRCATFMGPAVPRDKSRCLRNTDADLKYPPDDATTLRDINSPLVQDFWHRHRILTLTLTTAAVKHIVYFSMLSPLDFNDCDLYFHWCKS